MELVRLRSEVYSAYQIENILTMALVLVRELGWLQPVKVQLVYSANVWTLSMDDCHVAQSLRKAMAELNKFDLCPLCGAEHPQIACPLREVI